MTFLAGVSVLVTRPLEQSQGLCLAISLAGGKAVVIPMLAIRPVENTATALFRLRAMDSYDWIIFISVNAVQQATHILEQAGLDWSNGFRVAAIGPATARVLREHHLTVDLMPQQQFNSESLLAMATLQKISGQRVLIVRGEGGRELLADALRERGAQVDYAEVYRRVRPDPPDPSVWADWRAGGIACVSVFSGEALQNLVTVLEPDNLDLLQSTPLIVIGERLAEMARRLGCRRVFHAEEASDGAVFAAIGNALRVSQTET